MISKLPAVIPISDLEQDATSVLERLRHSGALAPYRRTLVGGLGGSVATTNCRPASSSLPPASRIEISAGNGFAA